MNLRSVFMPVVCFASASIFSSLCPEEENTLKTDYYEAAVNGGKSINYKRWNTSRSGKIILTHEERDLTRTGKFNQIDTIVFHDGKKLLHFMTIDGKRSCSYHPETGCTVRQGDSDDDGRYDRIVISDAKGTIVGYFDIAKDGKLSPISDSDLKKAQGVLKEFSEAMKNFDKR